MYSVRHMPPWVVPYASHGISEKPLRCLETLLRMALVRLSKILYIRVLKSPGFGIFVFFVFVFFGVLSRALFLQPYLALKTKVSH